MTTKAKENADQAAPDSDLELPERADGLSPYDVAQLRMRCVEAAAAVATVSSVRSTPQSPIMAIINNAREIERYVLDRKTHLENT